MKHFMIACGYTMQSELGSLRLRLCEWTRQPDCDTERVHIRVGRWQPSGDTACPDCEARLTLNALKECV